MQYLQENKIDHTLIVYRGERDCMEKCSFKVMWWRKF